MNNAGLITLFVVLQSSPPQTNPQFKEHTFVCSDIKYIYSIDNVKYPGINIDGKNYLTNELSYDILVSKVEKECKK